MRKALLIAIAAALVVVSGASFAAKKNVEIQAVGIGLGINKADVRLAFDPTNALGVTLAFQTLSGDMEGSQFGFGAYYLMRMNPPKPMSIHFIGGIDIRSIDQMMTSFSGVDLYAAGKYTTFTLYGGLGAECFLAGTDAFSVEGNVGFAIVNLSGDAKATLIGIIDPMETIMLRAYF